MNDYFLLFDECERIITDVSYRGRIAAPIDKFFEFKNKALVSATTLSYSDARFEEFAHVRIVPDYDYAKDLTLINTNNVISSIKNLADGLQSDHVCIFFNSTKGIHAVIHNLNVASETKVFCSDESVVKLMENKFTHASSDFAVKNMTKYNFFTSRYFSAIDIELDYKPDIIVVSDIFFADHSMLDPHTEVVQIAGRFRNGINSLTHITNFNPSMDVMTDDENASYIEGCLDTHEYIVKRFKKETRKGSKETLEFFVKNSPVAGFFTEQGNRNHFMIDNSMNEERVKRYYLSSANLLEAYEQVKSHFSVTSKDENYTIGDGDMYNLALQESKIDRTKFIAHLIQRHTPKPGVIRIVLFPDAEEAQFNRLKNNYPVVAEAVALVGVDVLDKKGYDLITLRKTIREAKELNQVKALAPAMHSQVLANQFIPEADVVSIISNVYQQHRINDRVFATHILKYFHGRRSTQQGVNGYLLGDRITY